MVQIRLPKITFTKLNNTSIPQAFSIENQPKHTLWNRRTEIRLNMQNIFLILHIKLFYQSFNTIYVFLLFLFDLSKT